MSMGIKVLYDWILQSNRPAHMKAGMFVFICDACLLFFSIRHCFL